MHHPAVVNLLLLRRERSSLRVTRHLRKRGVHGRIAISTGQVSTIVIVAVAADVNLHSSVGDGRERLVLISSSDTSCHIELISLGVR